MSAGGWLLMKAKTTCRCGPMGLVKQTAGLTLVDEKSSKGKGTNTIYP